MTDDSDLDIVKHPSKQSGKESVCCVRLSFPLRQGFRDVEHPRKELDEIISWTGIVNKYVHEPVYILDSRIVRR